MGVGVFEVDDAHCLNAKVGESLGGKKLSEEIVVFREVVELDGESIRCVGGMGLVGDGVDCEAIGGEVVDAEVALAVVNGELGNVVFGREDGERGCCECGA